MLVRTPVWCGYCPVNVALRDTQHSESTTKALSYDAPCRAMYRALRMVRSRSIEKSSISTKTMFGRRGSGIGTSTAGWATTDAPPPCPSGRSTPCTAGPPQAAASKAMTLHATTAIGPRRMPRF